MVVVAIGPPLTIASLSRGSSSFFTSLSRHNIDALGAVSIQSIVKILCLSDHAFEKEPKARPMNSR